MPHLSASRELRMVADPSRSDLSRFVLYQRDDCHLCDLALAALAEAGCPDFDSVFIDDDTALEAVYGARVPVLRDRHAGHELDWPFDAATARRWLAM